LPSDIEPASVIQAQIQRARAELDRAGLAVTDPAFGTWSQDPVGRSFSEAIGAARTRLAEVERAVLPGPPVGTAWADLLRAQAQVDSVRRESLAFLGGVLLRGLDHQGESCELAEAMLRELNQHLGVEWANLVLPGEEEFTARLTSIVRVRFPHAGVWELPIAVHEFGHVVAHGLAQNTGEDTPRRNPLAGPLNAEGGVPPQREELFADFFATYTVGPAFACTLLLLRFNPELTRPEQDFEAPETATATHPTVDKRAELVLWTLRRMNETAGNFRRPYAAALTTLETAWRAQLAAARPQAELSRLTRKKLSFLGNQFWQVAEDHFDARVRHAIPMDARGLVDQLTSSQPLGPIADGVRVLDVVGAAWRARLQQWGERPAAAPDSIGARALELARAAAAARPGGAAGQATGHRLEVR
jgi:hypothetical protein